MADLSKLFYRIGEVAQIVGVEVHVLRYWETEFPSVRPMRSRKGQRVYSRRDVELLLEIRRLLKVERLTVEGARKRLSGERPSLLRRCLSYLEDLPSDPVLERLKADVRKAVGS